jgi:hypothetical protein
MYWKITLLGSLFIMFCSCSDSENHNSEGTISQEACFDTLNTEIGFDEICYRYYPDSMVRYIKPLRGNQLHGIYIEYFQDGSVRVKENYVKGLKSGLSEEFYQNGNIKRKAHYILVGEEVISGEFAIEEHLNQIGVYNLDGQIIGDSSFYFNLKTVNMSLEDSILIDFVYYSPYYGDSLEINFGQYDNLYFAHGDIYNVVVGDFNVQKKFKVPKSIVKDGKVRGIIEDFSFGNEASYKLYFSSDILEGE